MRSGEGQTEAERGFTFAVYAPTFILCPASNRGVNYTCVDFFA